MGGWMELVALAVSVIDSLVDRLEGHRGKRTAKL
jgi:hypothetical protein